jgi:hypothetical protein
MDFDTTNPPKEITLNVYPMLSEHGWVTLNDIPLPNYVLLADPVEVTFKIKMKEELTSNLVDNLKTQEQEIRAKAEIKCKNIQDKIQSLLALPLPD